MKWEKDAVFKALADSIRRLIVDELSEHNELSSVSGKEET
jgi:DNA-binding transcriptional ArsR family regulator